LATLFTQLGIRSLCDAPCGDGSWIFEITGGCPAARKQDCGGRRKRVLKRIGRSLLGSP
jgi:hypothetical protein